MGAIVAVSVTQYGHSMAWSQLTVCYCHELCQCCLVFGRCYVLDFNPTVVGTDFAWSILQAASGNVGVQQ